MRRIWLVLLSVLTFAASLRAQQTCASYTVVINSPEDKLMLAVNGADNPQDQVTALQNFLQKNLTSKFAPCVYQNLTKAYVKLKDYPNATEAGQKAVAAGYLDVPFLENLLQAYIAGGTVSDDAFTVISKAAAEIKAESIVARSMNETDADYAQMKKQAEAGAAGEREYMEYAFFQLFPRLTDPAKRIAALDQFTVAYPEILQKDAGLVDYQYATAYTAANQTEKADEYAEKAIAADPANVEALNMLAFDYSIVSKNKKLEAAAADAQKVIQLAPAMKQPNGMTDDQFKALQNNLLGTAHLSLGYIYLTRASSGKRYATHSQMAPAISDLESAASLLANSTTLQGGALFYLANAYEEEYPAEHREAAAALAKSVDLQSPWQASARDLLARVKRAMR